MGIAQAELLDDVVTDVAGGAGGKGGDALIGEIDAQAAQLAIFWPEFVAPFRDAVSFINREKRDGHAPQPLRCIRSGEALGRKIQQAILSFRGVSDHLSLPGLRERAVEQRGWDSHLRELRYLILHQRDQRRYDNYGFV